MANTIILPFSELQAELNDEAMIDPNAIIEITENGLYNVAKYGYANVNVEGGGSSDFSTAILTMINTTENPVIFEVPCFRDGVEVLSTRAVIFGALGGEPATETINVVCKSNGATLTIASEGVTATTSGDIQFIQDQNLYIITGDCTITINGNPSV